MKLHVSLYVEDIQSATLFYSKLFNQSPAIEKENYVKWDVDNPAVNFVIESGVGGDRKPGLDHLGIQVGNQDELESLTQRFTESGHAHTDIDSSHCCYARMDKSWVKGAANENWEAFLTHSHDDDSYGDSSNPFTEGQPSVSREDADCCVKESCCN